MNAAVDFHVLIQYFIQCIQKLQEVYTNVLLKCGQWTF